MENQLSEKERSLKIPKDIPEGFFNIVSDLLSFVESMDSLKNEQND